MEFDTTKKKVALLGGAVVATITVGASPYLFSESGPLQKLGDSIGEKASGLTSAMGRGEENNSGTTTNFTQTETAPNPTDEPVSLTQPNNGKPNCYDVPRGGTPGHAVGAVYGEGLGSEWSTIYWDQYRNGQKIGENVPTTGFSSLLEGDRLCKPGTQKFARKFEKPKVDNIAKINARKSRDIFRHR